MTQTIKSLQEVVPKSINLPIHFLASSFSDVTNSYKFYWFLSILEYIYEHQSPIIPINNLLARMIAGVWYPTNYFRLSFGKQDRLGQISLKVSKDTDLPIDSKRQVIIETIETFLMKDLPIVRDVKSLGNYVPYRFLRPFFAVQLRGLEDWKVNRAITEYAQQTFFDLIHPSLYRFVNRQVPSIEIHPQWFSYLHQHINILIGFSLWNLVGYLQKHNPTVPNINSKLFEPSQRELAVARNYWRIVFDQSGTLNCVYSGQEMDIRNFSLDHFLPWRFVAHDLLRNIVPTSKKVNSSKCDFLPDFNCYFNPFSKLQYQSVQLLASLSKGNLLEDYHVLFGTNSMNELQNLPFQIFREKLQMTIAPQFQIAANMGFSTGWVYVR